MAKNLEISFLLDFYGSMLTEKQRIMIEYYYNDDISLSEIAGILKISRQGVYDTLKRAEKIISDYDNKLQLLNKYEQNIKMLEKAEALIDNKEALSLIKKVKENL